MTTLEDIFEERVELPKGLLLVENEADGTRYVSFHLGAAETEEDRLELEAFIMDVQDYIPEPLETQFGVQVGKYLQATDNLTTDAIFGDSIIKITTYRPLIPVADAHPMLQGGVSGTGALKDHPSEGFEAGWNLKQLMGEVVGGYWSVLDEEQARKAAESKGYEFIP